MGIIRISDGLLLRPFVCRLWAKERANRLSQSGEELLIWLTEMQMFKNRRKLLMGCRNCVGNCLILRLLDNNDVCMSVCLLFLMMIFMFVLSIIYSLFTLFLY